MNKIVKILLIVIGLVAAVLWFSLPSADDQAPSTVEP